MGDINKNCEICPSCTEEGIKEELLLIPPRENNKRPILCCPQCDREYPCDDNGKIIKSKNMVCY
jgi:hypothetical protein